MQFDEAVKFKKKTTNGTLNVEIIESTFRNGFSNVSLTYYITKCGIHSFGTIRRNRIKNDALRKEKGKIKKNCESKCNI